jgi:lysophospholipase L1-like esterase
VNEARRAAALLVAVLVLAALAACSDSATSPPETAPPSSGTAAPTTATTTADAPLVAMLGDSNTYLSIPELEAAFRDAGLRSTIRGISGSGLKDLDRDWLPAARTIAAAPPAAVVIALGTNDALEARNVAAFRDRLDTLLDAIGAVPVVWVTHTEHAVEGRDPADERAVNDVIRAAPAQHPNVAVLDLAPEIDADRALLDTDALHFSDVGQLWFADRIAAAACHAASVSRCSCGGCRVQVPSSWTSMV